MMKSSVGANHCVLMDAHEMYDVAKSNLKWMKFQEDIHYGVKRTPEFLQKVVTGDESLVARADALLTKIEDQIPVSKGWRNVDDVVGAIPNVPAFLAGHPQHMRRRERTVTESAPITIFMNLTSSMGISPDKILQRGITLLALVRLLVEHRSVELWVGTCLGRTAAMWKIDTAPMDLARAAFHICDPSMSRLFGYATCEMLVNEHIGGGAPTQALFDLMSRTAGWNDVMMIPYIHLDDPMVANPVGWLKRVMSKYVSGEVE
jgi:hypothetical protein